MNYKNLLMVADNNYHTSAFSHKELEKVKDVIKDRDYLKFVKQLNGGFFYAGALQIYSICETPDFASIFCINDTIKTEYRGIIAKEFFFAQEIFGNQFGFSSDGIVFLISKPEKKKSWLTGLMIGLRL